jgi:hypothetical protein
MTKTFDEIKQDLKLELEKQLKEELECMEEGECEDEVVENWFHEYCNETNDYIENKFWGRLFCDRNGMSGCEMLETLRYIKEQGDEIEYFGCDYKDYSPRKIFNGLVYFVGREVKNGKN